MKLGQARERLQARSYAAVAMLVGRLQRGLLHEPMLRKQIEKSARRLNVKC
jgi:hypothetical protein